jgi:hypothetical protein
MKRRATAIALLKQGASLVYPESKTLAVNRADNLTVLNDIGTEDKALPI